jgi:hypothetical protein
MSRKSVAGNLSLGTAIVLILLFPPRIERRSAHDWSTEWDILFRGGGINFGILFVELAIIGVVATIVYRLFKSPTKRKSPV